MSQWQVQSPDYVQRVKDSFYSQTFMQELKAEIEVPEPGRTIVTAPFQKRFSQQHGYWHAGAVSALVDTACGYAAYTLMPEDANVLSVEFKINLLSPAKGERFIAEGVVLKPGRTLTVCEGKVHAEHGGERKLIAAIQVTVMTLRSDK